MNNLSNDCLENIIENLDIASINKMTNVSNYYRNFISSNEQYIYQKLMLRDFNMKTKNNKRDYKKLLDLDLNGTYVVDNNMVIDNEPVKQTYKVDIVCEKGSFKGKGDFYDKSTIEEEICFLIDGVLDKWGIRGKVVFVRRYGDKIGESEYEGRVNVEKYLRSGVIEVNSTFYYKNIKGETKAQKL